MGHITLVTINSLRPSDTYMRQLTIGSDNGLSPGRRQAIIWINDGILLIRPIGTNFSEILMGNQTFSFMKMHLKMSSARWRPFYLGLSVLIGVLYLCPVFNSLSLRRNRCHFANSFKCTGPKMQFWQLFIISNIITQKSFMGPRIFFIGPPMFHRSWTEDRQVSQSLIENTEITDSWGPSQ